MQWLRLYLLSIVPLLEIALLWKYPYLLFFLLLAIAVFALWGAKKEELLVFFLATFWGLALDVVGVSFGVGTYTNAQLWGVPLWTPLLWGLAALFIKEVLKVPNARKP